MEPRVPKVNGTAKDRYLSGPNLAITDPYRRFYIKKLVQRWNGSGDSASICLIGGKKVGGTRKGRRKVLI